MEEQETGGSKSLSEREPTKGEGRERGESVYCSLQNHVFIKSKVSPPVSLCSLSPLKRDRQAKGQWEKHWASSIPAAIN